MKLRVLLGVINLVRKPCFLLFLLWFQQGEAIIAVEHPWAWVPMGLEENYHHSEVTLWQRGAKPQPHTGLRWAGSRVIMWLYSVCLSSCLELMTQCLSSCQAIKRRCISQDIWDIKIEIFFKSEEYPSLPVPAWQRWWLCLYVNFLQEKCSKASHVREMLISVLFCH